MDLIVTNNEFTGSGTPNKYGAAIALENVGKSSLVKSMISGNTISGFDRGIIIGGSSSDLLISNNDVSGCSIGIRFVGSVVMNTVDVEYNDIAGNTQFGLKNECTSGTVNALYNWWGNINGPKQVTTNPGGLGDEVSDNVDYQPWLTRQFQTVLDDNIAYFGEAIVNLDTGWNIFSTPIALDPDCDTWGEYVALGDGLSIHGTSPTYAFNSATQSWDPIYSNYQLKPCEAIYVRMAQADISPILYSPNLSVPSMQLYSGWNLVGLANLQDLAVGSALVSAYNVIGDLTGYSLAVSPSIGNQTAWIFVRGVQSQESMQVTKGYWVFMINPGTLAGFTFTPMSLP